MRLLAAALTATVTTLLLSSCVYVLRPSTDGGDEAPVASPGSTGSTGSTQNCTGNDITLTESGASFTLTGDCGVLTIQGNDIEVDANGLEALVMQGDRNDVDAAAVDRVDLTGNDNTLDLGEVGGLNLTGDRNDVDADTVFAVTFAGNDNTVDAPVTGEVLNAGERNVVTD